MSTRTCYVCEKAVAEDLKDYETNADGTLIHSRCKRWEKEMMIQDEAFEITNKFNDENSTANADDVRLARAIFEQNKAELQEGICISEDEAKARMQASDERSALAYELMKPVAYRVITEIREDTARIQREIEEADMLREKIRSQLEEAEGSLKKEERD